MLSLCLDEGQVLWFFVWLGQKEPQVDGSIFPFTNVFEVLGIFDPHPGGFPAVSKSAQQSEQVNFWLCCDFTTSKCEWVKTPKKVPYVVGCL